MHIGYIKEGNHPAWQENCIRGVIFEEVVLPEQRGYGKILRRRFWRKLARRGVRQCIMEKRWEQEAAGFGMVRVTPAALRQALLPDFLPEMAGKTVKLKAASNSEMVEKAAYLLADRARYVELDITWGQEELAKKLWQRYGLSRTGGEPWLTVDFTDTVPGALSLGSGGTMEDSGERPSCEGRWLSGEILFNDSG